MIYSTSPMVLFATPGMLHGGLSLAVFKEWCTNEKNTLIIPGYCSPGTMGDILLRGTRNIEIDNKWVQVKCEILNMSFSAHADAQGLLKIINQVQPEGVVLVHGEKEKMYSFSEKIKEVAGLPVYVPENNKILEVDVNILQEVGFSLPLYNSLKDATHLIKAMGDAYANVIPQMLTKIEQANKKLIARECKLPQSAFVSCKVKQSIDPAKVEETIKSFKDKALKYLFRIEQN